MARANLNRLEYFVAIVEEGTITAAATRMRISKAVVSKQLQLLEEELGAALILRNSRHLNLTEVGQTFYQAARASVAQAEEAYEIVRQGHMEPAGNLRITAPLDLGVLFVAPVVAEFRAGFPAVTIDLTLSDTQFDPLRARFDIAYRVGWLSDSANVARKLASFEQIPVAAPSFLNRLATLNTPEDLASLPCIEHRGLPNPLRWSFTHADNPPKDVVMTPALSADVTPAIKAMTLQGAGISVLPDFVTKEEIANGDLVRVLPDWSLRAGGVYSVYPQTQFRSSATKRFAALFSERFSQRMA